MNKTTVAMALMSFACALSAQTEITDSYSGQNYEYEQFKGAILNDTVSGNDYIFSGNEISGNTLTADAQIIGGLIKTNGKVSLNDVTMSDNIFKLSNTSGTTTMYMLTVDAREYEINGGKYSGNEAYINTPANGTVYGLFLNVMYGRTGKVDGAEFSGNYAQSNYRVQGGALNVNYNGAISSLYVSNSSFLNNTVEAGNKARGAAVENYAAFLDMRDSLISGNVSKSPNAAYGAFYASNEGAVSNATDVVFTNNSALQNGYGAAMYVEAGAVANVNVTKDTLYSGNFAEVNGVKDDSRGGFLYMKEGGTVNFNISEGATLTIGESVAGYDSIANQDASDSISKTGAGTLTVNSSMQYFTGTLNVNGGTMNLGKGAVSSSSVAGDINVSDGAIFDSNYGDGARNWLVVKNGQSVNIEGEGSTWKHSYQAGINEGGKMNIGAGSTADLGYLAFGGTADIDGTLVLGKNWVQAQLTSNLGGDYTSLGGGKTVMNINDGGVVEAYAGINVGHRADASVSKDAELNVNAGGLLDIKGGDLNISSTNYNGNGTSGKGFVNVNGGEVRVAQAMNIGTKADGYLNASNGAKVSVNDITLGVFDESLANDTSVSAPSAVFSAKNSTVVVSNHMNIGKGGIFSLEDSSTLTISGENGAGDITIRNVGTMAVSGANTSVDISNTQHNIYINGGGTLSISDGAKMSTAGNLSHGGVLDIDGGSLSVSKLGNIGEFENSAVVNVKNGGEFNSAQSINLGFYSNYSQANKGGVMNVLGGTVNANGGMVIRNGSILNINETGKINAPSITIASDGFMNLTIGSANQINASIDNSGTFSITAGASIADGNYNVATGSISGSGKILAYGGTYADNIFTVSRATLMDIDVPGEAITVANNGRVNLSDKDSGDVKIAMAFNSDSATVNAVSTTTQTLQDAIGTDFVEMGSYSFDVTMDSGDTVVLSFLVGNSSLTAADFTVYHKTEGGEWAAADDIENLAYDGEYLSFIVSHFSEYGYAAVPEPETVAAIFGALALAFCAFRRRK